MATTPFPLPQSAPPQDFVPLSLLQLPDDTPEDTATVAAVQVTTVATERAGVIHLSPDQEARLLRQLRAHYEEAMQGMDELLQRRETRYQRYLCDVTLRQGRQAWDDSGQLFLPMTRTSLETLKDELSQAIGGVDSVSVEGVGDEDAEKASTQSEFLRHALREINPEHWEELLDAAEHDALQDAIAYFKVYPYEHPFFEDDGGERGLLKTIVRIDVVDEGTMLIPPNATKLQWPEASYMGQRLWPSIDELQTMEGRGFQVPDATSLGTLGDQQQYTDDERKLLEFTRQGMQPDEASGEYDPRIEMVEMYELFALREGQPREFLTIHWFPHVHSMGVGGSDGHIARVMRTNDALKQQVWPRVMWPFFPMTCWQQPRQLRGLSLVDRLESSQDLLNRLAEQMVEHGEVSILPYIFANVALAGDLPNLRRIKPGEVVPLDNMGSVTFSPQQSHSTHYIQQMQVARTWGEEDSGVTAFIQGRSAQQPNAPRTLGQVSLMLQQSQKGFKKQVQHQARQLREVLKMYMGLWQGHVQPSLTIAVPDYDGLEQRLFEGKAVTRRKRQPIGPQDLAGPFDLVLKVNPEAHLEQQKLFALAEKLDGILAPIWPLGRRELWKGVWASLGLQEFEKYYPESVATIQTLLLSLQAQLQLVTLEAQLMQAGQQPGTGALTELFSMEGLQQALGAPPQPTPQGGASGAAGGVGGPASGLQAASPSAPGGFDLGQLQQLISQFAPTGPAAGALPG